MKMKRVLHKKCGFWRPLVPWQNFEFVVWTSRWRGVSKEWYTNENKGVSHAPVCCFSCRCFSNFGLERDNISATPSTYPTSSPNIFYSFLEGALGLANPLNAFSFHWLFAFIPYLIQPLFLPRSQIKQLGTLASLPSYWSAKIKQFGQISFSILQHGNWKHGMIQIRLLNHP